MLRIVPFGRDALYLMESSGRAVGRIYGATIRIGAFATEPEAVAAAVRGADALDAHLAARDHEASDASQAADDAPSSDVRLVHDGAYEWIVRARRPLARLIRPHALRPTSDEGDEAPCAIGATVAQRPTLREWRAADASHALPSHCFALEFIAPASVPVAARLTLARVLHDALAAAARTQAAPTAPPRQAASHAPVLFGTRTLEMAARRLRGESPPLDGPPAA